jgi:siroheme synthase
MERRRPNRESKNSEDVQDALIEDYFRYNNLSRMEEDDIFGIGPIREIFVYCIDRFDNIKANKSRLITAGLGLITRPTANMKNITKSILLFEKILVRIFTVSRLLKLKMERRRPNRELKNSEDVQDALIEDYFRYKDLSRMEADDILVNISEIESPNYEYTLNLIC